MISAVQWMSDNGLPPHPGLLAAIEARDREVRAAALREAAGGVAVAMLAIDGGPCASAVTMAARAMCRCLRDMADRAERGES